MNVDTKLEFYLFELDQALGPIATSERAEIIMEIKSHVLDAMAKDPSTSVAAVLDAMGDPKQVANRYLLERGLKPNKPKRSILRSLLYTIIGIIALFVLLIVLLIWRCTPLIQVNEHGVRILGGLIDVADDGERGDWHFGSEGQHSSKGSAEIDRAVVKEIFVPFSNARFEFEHNDENKLSWECRHAGKLAQESLKNEGVRLVLDFSTRSGIRCDIKVPRDIKLVIDGSNGRVLLGEPLFDTDVKISNGRVAIKPSAQIPYHYDLSVVNGHVAEFDSSNDARAYKIQVKLVNGNISKE